MTAGADMPRQQSFELPAWGGKRRGAGRKPATGASRIPHVAREEVRPYQPVHVTLRMAEPVWNLRSQRSYRIVDAALRAARRRPDFRVVHFSVQGNHVHLIVEAGGTRAFATGVRALSIRLARRLNAMMGRSGPVFADRSGSYPSHCLPSGRCDLPSGCEQRASSMGLISETGALQLG
jgi:REP element-mobilizing transposase RayT